MEKYIQSLEDQIALYKRQTSSQQEELVLLRQKVKVLEGELNASLAQSKSQQVCHESKSIHTTNTATSNHVVHHATVDGYAKRKRSETISPTEMQNSFEVATSLVSLPKAGGLYSHPPSHNNSRAPSPVDNVGPKEIYSFSTSQGLDYSNMAGTTGSSSYIPGIGRKLPRLLPHSDSFGHRSTVSVPQIINESKYAHSSAVNPPSHRATASMSSLRQIESIKSLGPACGTFKSRHYNLTRLIEGCRVRKRKCGRERPHCSYCVKIHRNKSGPVQCSYSTYFLFI